MTMTHATDALDEGEAPCPVETAMQVIGAVHPTVSPRVEYALTPTGMSFRGALAALCAWGEQYLEGRQADVEGRAHAMA